MDRLDLDLLRAHEIFLDDLSDETDRELGELLPQLEKAGYVEISGESPSGYFWNFTPEGVARGESLGAFD
jgi:hypothetical protein